MGLAYVPFSVEKQIDEEFMLMLGDNVFDANLANVVRRQREYGGDGAFLIEELPYDAAYRHGVCVTNDYGEIIEVVNKPDDPSSHLVMTGFYTFSPAISHACHLVQPSTRVEYEISEATYLLLHSGLAHDSMSLEGWRIHAEYPEDCERAETLLRDQEVVAVEE